MYSAMREKEVKEQKALSCAVQMSDFGWGSRCYSMLVVQSLKKQAQRGWFGGGPGHMFDFGASFLDHVPVA